MLSDGENYLRNKNRPFLQILKWLKEGFKKKIIGNGNCKRRENKVTQETFLTNLTQKKFLFRSIQEWVLLDCSYGYRRFLRA